MQPSQPPPTDTAHCPLCRARLGPALPFCPTCGAQLDNERARAEEELRSVLFLLSELESWESSGQLNGERASHLRTIYEDRRDTLRRVLSSRDAPDLSGRAPAPEEERGPKAQTAAERADQFKVFPVPQRTPGPAVSKTARPISNQKQQRTLFERLADPQTLRLLLYMGAGMLVVGVVIWLRDLLYLKLQEPMVQAGLLAFGTGLLIGSGWYASLRTRQRWTGRALTLAGSLLFPVNFWFLVRSGLIENQGRGWVVCAFCALLYGLTAAALRERLYIHLSCAAAVATLWALILRDAPRAFGLYALALMTAALVFLHLAPLFPPGAENTGEPGGESGGDERRQKPSGRLSRELWSGPLAGAALACALLGLLFYLPLRVTENATAFHEGILRLLSSSYDASIALLLAFACAYVFWFAGRFVFPAYSRAFYSASALLFFLAVWVACDGFGLTAQATVLVLAAFTFIMTLAARASVQSPSLNGPLHHASLLVSIILAITGIAVMLDGPVTATVSASLALVAASLAALNAPRSGSRRWQSALAHLSALYFSISYFAALASASLESETLSTLLGVLWPLALYGAAELLLKLKRETELAAPFTRVADAFAMLALLWGSLLALLIHLLSGGASRSASIAALSGVLLYGAIGTMRRRSIYTAALGTLAAVIMTAALLDALKKAGFWPAGWPVAAGTIVFIFIFEQACARLLRPAGDDERAGTLPLIVTIRLLLDLSVAASSLIWLVTAFDRIEAGGLGAAVVLLFALIYWVERVAHVREPWPVRVTAAHMGAFLFALLIALRVSAEWINLLFVLTIFPALFILSRYTRSARWLSDPLNQAAAASLLLSLLVAFLQAGPGLRVGDEQLLAPSLAVGAIALLSFAASIFSKGRESLRYFRTGLWTAVVSLMLASLRAGFHPFEDVEIYTTPIAVLLLVIAYLSMRRAWAEYDRDVGVLLWIGSLLLSAPLLVRAMEYRLLLDTAAPWRDMAVLVASLALIFYGIVGRMRAPVLIGAATLITELSVLTLTSVDWLQVPLKYYLMTVGALLLIIFGTLEYKREQFLLVRRRFRERRDSVREQFNEWR